MSINETTPDRDRIARKLHYPEHWDTAAYPTLESAIIEAIQDCSECQAAPVAVGMREAFEHLNDWPKMSPREVFYAGFAAGQAALASQAAPTTTTTTTLTDGLRDQLETLGAHDTGGRFCVYMSRADARAILATTPTPDAAKGEQG